MKLITNSVAAQKGIADLDSVDRAILRHLQQDASLSIVSLAAKVKRSAPACLRRVERLKKTGLIRRVVARLDAKALGVGMFAVIGIVLDGSTPEAFAAFEKAAQKVSGCVACHAVSGKFDYVLLVRARGNESFNRLHAAQLLHLPGVRELRSFKVLKEVLSTQAIPL
ncbi:Lrp/AsnC family transcriptional regulator [Paraburkholderia sp. EG287A]|uniref:Lrp/AsnC family transcriptional regulator n=1 Tax=unclassified Paraburkholderia TaxID=2615204 RepID=UPI0034D23735